MFNTVNLMKGYILEDFGIINIKKPIDLLGNKKLNLVPMWAYSPAQMLMDHAKAGPNEQ